MRSATDLAVFAKFRPSSVQREPGVLFSRAIRRNDDSEATIYGRMHAAVHRRC